MPNPDRSDCTVPGCTRTDRHYHRDTGDGDEIVLPPSETIHVEPVNDPIEHDTSGGDCVCGPTTTPVEREDGSMGWVVTHHSLDGREAHE